MVLLLRSDLYPCLHVRPDTPRPQIPSLRFQQSPARHLSSILPMALLLRWRGLSAAHLPSLQHQREYPDSLETLTLVTLTSYKLTEPRSAHQRQRTGPVTCRTGEAAWLLEPGCRRPPHRTLTPIFPHKLLPIHLAHRTHTRIHRRALIRTDRRATACRLSVRLEAGNLLSPLHMFLLHPELHC